MVFDFATETHFATEFTLCQRNIDFATEISLISFTKAKIRSHKPNFVDIT